MRTHLTRVMAAVRRFTLALLRALGRFGTGVAEMSREQNRLAAQHMSYDSYMTFPGTPPDTYAEFLLRSSGPLRHEPSARQRLAGHTVH